MKKLFDESMANRYKSIDIIKLDNSYTKFRFDLCYRQIKKFNNGLYKNNNDPETKLLFHGTGTTKPEIIYKGVSENFNVLCSGKGYWGFGIYFACKAVYSCDSFIYEESPGHFSLLVAEVIIGNACDVGKNHNKDLKQPPNLPNDPHNHYDSVKANTANHDIYVIYDNNQAYSKYLIKYAE